MGLVASMQEYADISAFSWSDFSITFIVAFSLGTVFALIVERKEFVRWMNELRINRALKGWLK